MTEEEQKPKEIREITIRVADASDAHKIYPLFKKHMKYECPHLPEPIANHALPWLTDLCVNGLVLVADMGGTLVGCVGGKPGIYPWNRTQPFLYGELFCLLPEYAKHGAGPALLGKLRRHANLSMVDCLFYWLGSSALDEKQRLMHMDGFVDCGGVLFLKAMRQSEEPVKETLH